MIIDVSHYQGVIDWTTVAPRVQGAYLKVTEGTTVIDTTWSSNHGLASEAGVPLGAYHFADLDDPVTEANHFADVYLTGGASWRLHPVLDIETAGATTAWITAFRSQFRSRVGTSAFRIYTSVGFLEGALDPTGWIDDQTTIWAARYGAVLGWDHPRLVLWQNTSTATVPGVLGDVDEDQFLHGWSPTTDAGGFSPLGSSNMSGINSHWMADPLTGLACASFEVGSNSEVVTDLWVAAKAIYGDVPNATVIFTDDAGHALTATATNCPSGQLPSFKSNDRYYWKAPSGASDVTIKWDPTQATGRLLPYFIWK